MKRFILPILCALACSAPAFAIQFENIFYSGTPERILDGLSVSTTAEKILFETPAFYADGESRFADLTIKYDAIADDHSLFDDMLLAMEVKVSGNAFVHVEETIRDADTNAILATISATYRDSGLKEEHVDYGAFATRIKVYKDITVVAQGVDAYAAVSSVLQAPSQVPEPAGLSLAAFGGIALLRRLRRL
jgi:hypothetical protein